MSLRNQRPNPKEHQREHHIRDHAIAEEWNGLGIALNQAGKVLGVSDVAESPYGEVAGEEEADARSQACAKNIQRLDAIAEEEPDEARNKVPAPHHNLIESERNLINAQI